MSRSVVCVVIAVVMAFWGGISSPSRACLNDWRTRNLKTAPLIQDLLRDPEAEEKERRLLVSRREREIFDQERQRKEHRLVRDLITGRFARLSKEFHRWRIRDRQKKQKSDPNNPIWYDDLAVSYDKLGRYEKAIQAIQKKLRFSTHRYETLANLGTFYIHRAAFQKKTKLFPKGLAFLKEAVALNPDAHFGREIYQILLVEYVMQEGRLSAAKRWSTKRSAIKEGFSAYVMAQSRSGRRFVAEQYFPSLSGDPRALRDAAVRGILGMMRFGRHDSPILLSALGSLLAEGYGINGQRMAVRAFLKASYETKYRRQKAYYHAKAKEILAKTSTEEETNPPIVRVALGQNGLVWEKADPLRWVKFRAFETSFRQEVKEASRWSVKIRRQLRGWLRDKKQDPEALFLRHYLANSSTTTGKLLLLSNKAFSRYLTMAFATPEEYLRHKKPKKERQDQIVAKKAAMQKASESPQPVGVAGVSQRQSQNNSTASEQASGGSPLFAFSFFVLFSVLSVLFLSFRQAQQRRRWEMLSEEPT
jgi:tetratricopeptide (TPR) repeat protein